MKLTPAQLAKHLQGPLAPVYVVSGDEPLLCQEACDAIRQACRERDFGERQVFSKLFCCFRRNRYVIRRNLPQSFEAVSNKLEFILLNRGFRRAPRSKRQYG